MSLKMIQPLFDIIRFSHVCTSFLRILLMVRSSLSPQQPSCEIGVSNRRYQHWTIIKGVLSETTMGSQAAGAGFVLKFTDVPVLMSSGKL
jgi:hypothetical protein